MGNMVFMPHIDGNRFGLQRFDDKVKYRQFQASKELSNMSD
jgi:hypothetical protein